MLARFDARARRRDRAASLPAVVVTHHGVLRLVATRAGVDVHTLIPNLGGYWFRVESGELHSPTPLDALPTPDATPDTE